MTIDAVRPLPAAFPLVAVSSGLSVSIVSGPALDTSAHTPVARYVLELRCTGDEVPVVRFPYTPGLLRSPEIMLVDVLFDVTGDILHCEQKRTAGDMTWPSAALHVPADMVSDVAASLERSLGATQYRLLLAECEAEEREWLHLLSGSDPEPVPRPPCHPARQPRRSRERVDPVHDQDLSHALDNAWQAVVRAASDRERGEALQKTAEVLLALGLPNAAADAFRGALRAADQIQSSDLRARALIGQMRVAALTRREALFEWFRLSIARETLDESIGELYDDCVAQGCRVFGRSDRDEVPERFNAPLSDGSMDERSVGQAMEATLLALSHEEATSIVQTDARCMMPEVARVVRALRARASFDAARDPAGPASSVVRALRRALARAHRAALAERHARGCATGVSRGVTSESDGASRIEDGLAAHAAPYAAALRSALAAGDVAWQGTGWLLGALESTERYGQALYEAGATDAAAAWFADVEAITGRAAPVFAAHALTWRAALARRSRAIGEARRLNQLALSRATRLGDLELLFAVGRQEAAILMAVGNLAHAEAAFRSLLTEAKERPIRSSRLIVAVMNDLAATFCNRANAGDDRARARAYLLEAAALISQAFSFASGFLSVGERRLLALNLAACCLYLGLHEAAALAYAALRTSAAASGLRSATIVAGALVGEIQLASLRGDRATFERLCVEADSLQTEPRARGVILLECARGWRRFSEASRADRLLNDLAAFAHAHEFNDLLLSADREGAELRRGHDQPAQALGTSETALGGALASAVATLARESLRARPGDGATSSPSLPRQPSGLETTAELRRVLEESASPFIDPSRSPDSLARATHAIRTALSAPVPRCLDRRNTDDALLAAIRHVGDGLAGSVGGPNAACAWYSSVLHASLAADRRQVAGWTLAWRARNLRLHSQGEAIRDGGDLAARNYAAALALAQSNGFHELALFSRHGLAAVLFEQGRAEDALCRLRLLVSDAQALGSKRVLTGVLSDVGVATDRVAATKGDDEARAAYVESAHWHLSAARIGSEFLVPVQREILLLNLATICMALGHEDVAARAAEVVCGSTSHHHHSNTAALLLLEAAGRRSDATGVDRWAAFVFARQLGPRAHADALLVTGRAYRMIGWTVEARSVLAAAAEAARVIPAPEMREKVRRERAALSGERTKRFSASLDAMLLGHVDERIDILGAAVSVGATADWE